MRSLRRIVLLVRASLSVAVRFGKGTRIQLLANLFGAVLQSRLPARLRKPRCLQLHFNGKDFELWILDRTSIAAFEEIFLRGEYDIPLAQEPRVVVDAGANIGVASAYFALRYPRAFVHAIEPDPGIAEILALNMRQFAQAQVHRLALSDTSGLADFYVHPSSSIASSLHSRTRDDVKISVPVQSFDDFVKEHDIGTVDLLKFDVEGAELALLRGISDRRSIGAYVGELHYDLIGSDADVVVKEMLRDFDVHIQNIGLKRSVLSAL